MNPYLSEAQLKNLLFALLSFSVTMNQSSLAVFTFLSLFSKIYPFCNQRLLIHFPGTQTQIITWKLY